MLQLCYALAALAALAADPPVVPDPPIATFPYQPSIYEPTGDVHNASARRSRFLSKGAHPTGSRFGATVEIVADGANTPNQHPAAADFAFGVAAFKAGKLQATLPQAGEIDGMIATVDQDNGDAAAYLASARLVDRTRANYGFIALFEGVSSLVSPVAGAIDQRIDVQLGAINTYKPKALGTAPDMTGVHAYKDTGSGGVALNVDSKPGARWDYGIMIARDGVVQFAQQTADGAVTIGGPLAAASARIGGDMAVGGTITGPPWTAMTPVVRATVGTIAIAGATGRYGIVGRTCTIALSVTVTRNGSGSGAVTVALPSGAAARAASIAVLTGRIQAGPGAGAMLQAVLTDRTLTISRYDDRYPAASGAVLLVSGSYEVP